ncbi:hypothetical protein EJ04DRAFT_577665 [Polyplosphaeria fusca]|uniref:Uncharacterized protein n=1 Tax=Polyplosphaeria fusca TaxID=682080 RepID=A0A9P4QXJ1_9PLEO|nr:hypothetical protein EJ04DRAFT_577665 [Polyplosphaeria fusca]
MHSLLPVFALLLPVTFALPTEWDGANLLIPDENGVLQYASRSQLQVRRDAARAQLETSHQLHKRDKCDDGIFTGSILNCQQYCERQVSDVVGDPVKVSSGINCNVGDVCDIAHADAVTITEGFTISIGGSSPAGAEGNGILSGSVSFSWSKAETTTDTWTFHPKNGDVGYIVFRPKFKQSTGIFQQWYHYESSDAFDVQCMDPIEQDTNASGRSPRKLDSGKADGEYSFCNTNTNQGC